MFQLSKFLHPVENSDPGILGRTIIQLPTVVAVLLSHVSILLFHVYQPALGIGKKGATFSPIPGSARTGG